MLKRFINYYFPHKGLFILDMTVAIIAAIASLFLPYLTRDLLKIQIPAKNTNMIIKIIVFIVLVFVVKAIMTYIRLKWGHFLGVRMEFDMRKDIFEHIQKLSFNYFDNVKTGHIMSRISNDLNLIAEIAHHAPEDLIISIFIIIGSFIFMFNFNVVLAFVSLIPVPLMLFWGWTTGSRMKKGFRAVRKTVADINSSVENSVQGIREVKSYANEELEISKFNIANCSFKNAKEQMYHQLAVFFSGMTFLRDLYYISVISAGIWLIYNNKIDVSDLLAFILYIGIILPPIDRLMNFAEQFQQGTASFERFIEIMDIDPDIKDKKNALSIEKIKGNIELKNIEFQYKTSSDKIIKNININIKAGEKIALVGESGAGKSTVVSLIPRFYEPQKGIILIDGNNIMDFKQKCLRKNIGIVQQDVFLFDGTIRENIMYGNHNATEEMLVNAAKTAHIYDFIMSLPNNFDTEIGERGVKLSGGQKQRVSIARVFLKDPSILIFDEATSSLDTESEKYIQDAMVKLSEDRTTIIIAHRLSTVRNVDNIYVMNNGQIVENGDHNTLISKKGYYYDLVKVQEF